MKLAFLLSREPHAPKTGIYEFLPYRRGPFSFTLSHDLRGLVTDGWVLETEHEISVAQVPRLETAFLAREFEEMIDQVSTRYRSSATSDLVDAVYAEHPWFTVNSESLLRRLASKPLASRAVYTVGYEGLMVDGLLDLLFRTGIRRLIDVRCNPVARRYGFHKATLNRLLQDIGMEYVHFPTLGIPSAWRANLNDQASYERLFGRYEREILPAQAAIIEQVGKLVADCPSALMCMEANRVCCHRSRLAEVVARQTALPIKELR